MTNADSVDRTTCSSLIWIAVAFLIAGLLLLNSVYFSQSRELMGVVDSIGTVDAGVGNGRGGGNREYASIKLANGNKVLARVSSIRALNIGESVTVLEQKRFVGPAVFQVVLVEPQR